MSIKQYIISHSELKDLLVEVIGEAFNLDPTLIPSQINKYLGGLFAQLKATNYYLIEYPYVDRVYRDSYYFYYSSKYGKYNRDCIKVSIFISEISGKDFRNNSIESLQSKFAGFFILRPTEPNFLGRNHINPKALDTREFEYCQTMINTTVNGIKFDIKGFPHASQDSETHSCAETTIWAIMEYFSSKYIDYKPVKPSQIHALLRQVSFERQVPTRGLTVNQISFALKELGFGSKVYARDVYSCEFESLLDVYISSGIPIIAGLDDFNHPVSNNIGHAVLIIGRLKKGIDLVEFKHLKKNQAEVLQEKQITLYDLNQKKTEYVFIDDNLPPYQLAELSSPAKHYSDLWQNVKIEHLIVPLYPKIYLEALEARNFILEFLINGPIPLEGQSSYCLNLFLASSRSFKHQLKISKINEKVKGLILEKPMPKFIWVVEIGTTREVRKNLRSGLIVLDATEPNLADNKPIIVGVYQNYAVYFNGMYEVFEKFFLPLSPFPVFINNLVSYEN